VVELEEKGLAHEAFPADASLEVRTLPQVPKRRGDEDVRGNHLSSGSPIGVLLSLERHLLSNGDKFLHNANANATHSVAAWARW